MSHPQRILLQTTLLAGAADDWTIETFSLLQDFLRTGLREPALVTARDRQPDAQGNDPVLSQLDRQDFDQLWLFALDVGDGLSPADAAGINRFHQQGGGIMATRDHQDMGKSLTGLDYIAPFHYFHTTQPDPDPERCCNDDCHTPTIAWPNYHSGANGDYQDITPTLPIHPLLKNPDSETGIIRYFPAHPHEGAVGCPSETSHAQVIATGVSLVTGRPFNLVVAVEGTAHHGRVVAQSTFHHFVDYNWDPHYGCPSFVAELPGNGMIINPDALADIYAYVRNLVDWLAPQGQ
ncbi:hypothetical protein RIF25_03510 [Thermosynechococcaceae cyanobacterium BACA0444]|uniref:Uncharacterized protein n=1 Tax=Pseudocalidococcus azoricus BACA0444 TaxID=2918990 RepID=A0AAE4FQJ8_9CYAN|nr:hypothetical protein [Pseudocalidococcus azoricus]MDS3859869.1 hypothetical protein [Pseudocalidococcus azoricus BACA0444]